LAAAGGRAPCEGRRCGAACPALRRCVSATVASRHSRTTRATQHALLHSLQRCRPGPPVGGASPARASSSHRFSIIRAHDWPAHRHRCCTTMQSGVDGVRPETSTTTTTPRPAGGRRRRE
jgi:hypothetical protein